MQEEYLNIIEVYTDGSAKGNPGKSGSGIVIYYPSGESREIFQMDIKSLHLIEQSSVPV